MFIETALIRWAFNALALVFLLVASGTWHEHMGLSITSLLVSATFFASGIYLTRARYGENGNVIPTLRPAIRTFLYAYFAGFMIVLAVVESFFGSGLRVPDFTDLMVILPLALYLACIFWTIGYFLAFLVWGIPASLAFTYFFRKE